MSDRQLGYVVLCILAVALATGMGLLLHDAMQPTETRVLTAPNTGSLKLADPVVVDGVPVGRVSRLDIHKREALVTVRFFNPCPIYADYTVKIVDLGIMGDRLILLVPGTPASPPLAPGDTLEAQFILGPSEGLAYIDRLHEIVEQWTHVSATFVHGDATGPSLIEQYVRLTGFTDSLSRQIVSSTQALDLFVSQQVDSIQQLVETAVMLSEQLSAHTPDAMLKAASLLETLGTALTEADTLLSQVRSITDKVDSTDMAELGSVLARLQQRLTTIRTILVDIRRHGINLKIWPF